MSVQERTGWRDEWISERHRTFGVNVPCVDIDCIILSEGADMSESGWNVMEYDKRVPRALIEYKAVGATINIFDANNKALCCLADMASLPFFIVVYDKAKLEYEVIPINYKAEELTSNNKVFAEPEFVEFLHAIRKEKVIK